MLRSWIAATILSLLSGPALAGELKFSAKAFLDVSYKQNVDEGTNTTSSDSGTGVDVKRFYFGADYLFNGLWSARFLTDIGDKGAKRYDVFVKNAYLQLKVNPLFVFRVGAAATPWSPFVEDHYALRYVENTFLDRVGYASTADWGVHALGDWNERVAYQLSIVNGRGFGDPTRSKSPTFEARVSGVPVPGLTVGVGALIGKLGQQTEGVTTASTAHRFDVLAAFERKWLRLGVEGFFGRNDTADIVLGEAPEDDAYGASAFGNVDLGRWVTLFARYDFFQPNHNRLPSVRDHYVNAGMQTKPIDAVSLALVYKHETVSSGSGPKGAQLSTANGAIGSTVPSSQGRFQEFGLFAQVVY